MSNVPATIDDVPIDWTSGPDNPDGAQSSPAEYIAALRNLVFERASTLPEDGHPEVLAYFDGDHPFLTPVTIRETDYWQTLALRRQISAAYDIPLRSLGIVPRYGLDARYRQRQRNRRKHRH